MRRALPLLLSLLLVCAQGAGLVHGIGHGATLHGPGLPVVKSGSTDVRPPAALQARTAQASSESTDGRCDKCFQFAHFSGNAAPQLLVLALQQTVEARAGGTETALVARDAPANRSRGPPILL